MELLRFLKLRRCFTARSTVALRGDPQNSFPVPVRWTFELRP